MYHQLEAILSEAIFKQFVVTTVSRERPGLTVAESLKTGILIPIDTSKESDFMLF